MLFSLSGIGTAGGQTTMHIDVDAIINAIVGGGLIGLSASMLLILSGRVAGISGIIGGMFKPISGDMAWRIAFVSGLLAGGIALIGWNPELLQAAESRSLPEVVLAGLLVGVGVRMGKGCTSGHGVCGLARLSGRSLVATLSFMATGFVTATGMYLVFGGVA